MLNTPLLSQMSQKLNIHAMRKILRESFASCEGPTSNRRKSTIWPENRFLKKKTKKSLFRHLKYTVPIKFLSKSRLSTKFFLLVFLVISEPGSRIYIVKSAILIFWAFLPIFSALLGIVIDNIECFEPFLPLWEHFWNRVLVQLNCTSDLTPHFWKEKRDWEKYQLIKISIRLERKIEILRKISIDKKGKVKGIKHEDW